MSSLSGLTQIVRIACATLLLPWLPTPVQSPAATPLPAFEVASVRPTDPKKGGGPVGFYSRPGGRVDVGNASVRMLLYYAFDIQDFDIAAGPSWMGTDTFNIVALPPDSSPSRTARQPPIAATPSPEQRLMLQSLLADRFSLKFHRENRESRIFVLTLGKKPLQLDPAEDPTRDSRGNLMGPDAFGTSLSGEALAEILSRYLGVHVLDRTGLNGSYDFHLAANELTNQDSTAAAMDAVDRLGLKLTRSRAPVSILVVDHIERPAEN